ncbi:unnamed protein product [Cylicostephanus goldi]|uniref:Uncharacterized protein n=1 Tax=Cylicostephanus goldi TaxID=71465 RepID=A0A3P6RGB2_CYLGO|nr:unnamed protein product [Cylicostephanus goldi]
MLAVTYYSVKNFCLTITTVRHGTNLCRLRRASKPKPTAVLLIVIVAELLDRRINLRS